MLSADDIIPSYHPQYHEFQGCQSLWTNEPYSAPEGGGDVTQSSSELSSPFIMENLQVLRNQRLQNHQNVRSLMRRN